MRIINILASAWLASMMPAVAGAQAIEGAPSGYSLRWSDEFNGTALNEKIWSVEVNGNGGGNQELQYYRRENVSVEGGNLVLTARRENFNGKSFTSGRINSQGKAFFKHGVLQARIKFPHCANGLWPAYWMMGNDINKYGWPRCGEMDIVELGHAKGIANGTQDRYFGGTLHYGANASNEAHQQISQEYTAPEDNPLAGDYHIITVEWDERNLYMYYDLPGYAAAQKRNSRYFSTSIASIDESNPNVVGNYFHKPYYFLFNLAVGGMFPSIYDPSGITALPNAGDEAKMYVDWVRVYQKDGDAGSQYSYVDEDGNTRTNIETEPEPEPEPDDKTELSGFASKALDADGETTFDFDDVSDAVLISTSDGVKGHLLSAGAAVTDYNVNEQNRNLYIWDNTYVAVDRTGETNSFGWGEGYNKFTVGSAGWSGLGFNIVNEDLSMIDDTYWLHFAMRATDQDLHTSHQITVCKAEFKVGNSDGKLAGIGDFKRDGEWYYFDIPVKVLEQFAGKGKVLGDNPKTFNDNVIAFLSGGVTDAELCFDNIFFYKSKTKEIPSYKDSDVNLGKYGYKSLDGNGNPVKTFTTDNVKVMAPLALDNTSRQIYTGNGEYDPVKNVVGDIKYDFTRDNNYNIWENTMWAEQIGGLNNSQGLGTEPFGFLYDNNNLNWNGYGIIGQTAKDFSMIDDTYYLHIDLISNEAVAHIPVTVGIGNTSLTFGSYSTKALFADFGRDGEWYSFDIPVGVLKQYGSLFEDTDHTNPGGTPDQKKNAWIDNFLTFSTGDTQYYGAGFAFDNIFFWQPADEADYPVVDELGEYTTKSLDADNNSYFNFAGKDFINFSGNGSVTEKMKAESEDNIILDLRDGIDGAKFNNWGDGNTYQPGSQSQTVADSFGGDEGWIDLTTNGGWTGAGFIRAVGGTGVDLTCLDEGEWYLHFAMRGTDNCNHQIGFAEAKFTIGSKPFAAGVPVLGNYKRDGEWYSYDIPYSRLKQLTTDMYPSNNGGQTNYRSNLIWFMSGGGTGDEIQLDNIFFWRDKSTTAITRPNVTPQMDSRTFGIYDISGRKVQNMNKRGLYIVRSADGVKKVLVK